MPELDVTPVTFKIRAHPAGRVGITRSTGARVILVPVPGGRGERGPAGDGAQIFGEAPAGDLDGVNAVFTVTHPFAAGSTAVYLNGLRESFYIESGPGEVTFDDPPLSTDHVSIDYIVQ